MWKPTKAGVYLLDRSLVCITQPGCSAIEMVASNSTTVINKTFAPYGLGADMVGDKWSLLAPDWQEWEPTVEQLVRWQWWAVVNEDGMLMASKWQAAWGMLFSVPRMVTPGIVTRSAPVQPVPGEVLWVPLEVCK